MAPTNRAVARLAKDPRPPTAREGDALATHLTDASRFPGGHAGSIVAPKDEGEVAYAVAHADQLLPIGAQSSLTGGATPQGGQLLDTARLTTLRLEGEEAVVGAGVSLLELETFLAERDAYYPPIPTYTGALVGGAVSTNAAGAATWKYGSTRPWVSGLTVVLASGCVLELRRGEVLAEGGEFVIETPQGELRVPVPTYSMPDVAKRSAGYHAEPGMDLIDLFIGAEGTLGVVIEVRLRVVSRPPQVVTCLVPFADEQAGLQLVAALRAASRATWASGDPAGVDVRAVESMDRRSVELLHEDGEDEKNGVELPQGTALALLVQAELPADFDAEEALARYVEGERGVDGLGALLALLEEHVDFDAVELAMPDDRARRQQLFDLREAVPSCVNHRVRDAQRDVDGRIHKVGGDMIVPFERFGEMLEVYAREFGGRGLDYAVWGHVSDGNVHPNVLPRSYADVEAGHEALLACGHAVARLGGCPLSEHGTGRNPIKQALLRQLYGDEGVAQMRAVKRALDPTGKLARDVIFPWEASPS
ncbi:MAG: FAD-binding oxidoreductase [Planctomycetes bacterium]|nr:FAD-binding oxidoreductase [Planctomycetota bacterium]